MPEPTDQQRYAYQRKAVEVIADLEETMPVIRLAYLDDRLCLELREPQGGANSGRVAWAPVDDPTAVSKLGDTTRHYLQALAQQAADQLHTD